MRWFYSCTRLIQIYRVMLKYGIDQFFWSHPHLQAFKRLKFFFPTRWFSHPTPPPASNIRLALEELGPIYVKVGQLLSTRRDALPDDLADELAKLQDNVPAFPNSEAIAIIEAALGQSVQQAFKTFDVEPLASASISQVHSATLANDDKVVVKVLRPHIQELVLKDVQLLESLAGLIERFVPESKRFHPLEVIHEVRQTLMDELDLMREAANASLLRRNFTNNDSMYVPKIYWEYCRQNVMVMERIHAVRISDIATLKAQKVNLKKLAERGVEIFFTQVFRDRFFHADMHPGNIFVKTDDPENPQYIAVDFGIMGTLDSNDQRYLGENFLAFFKRDYRRVAELHVESGWVPPHTSINAFESAIRTVCEPIFEKPLKEISFAHTLIRLFQTAKRFEMQIQPQLLLLQKTLLSIEGLGRQLYPDLDLWQTAKPFLEKWMRRHYGPKQFLLNLKEKLPFWSEKLPQLPETLYEIASYHQQQIHQSRYQTTGAASSSEAPIRLTHVLALTLLASAGACILAPSLLTTQILAGVGLFLGLYLLLR